MAMRRVCAACAMHRSICSAGICLRRMLVFRMQTWSIVYDFGPTRQTTSTWVSLSLFPVPGSLEYFSRCEIHVRVCYVAQCEKIRLFMLSYAPPSKPLCLALDGLCVQHLCANENDRKLCLRNIFVVVFRSHIRIFISEADAICSPHIPRNGTYFSVQ